MLLGRSEAAEFGWNWSKFWGADLDKMAAEADRMADPAKAADRMKLWSDVYMGAMDPASWLPVINEKRYTMTSDRRGGEDAFFVDPVATLVNYNSVLVT